MRVELSDEAQHQVSGIDTWWRENREKAPNLFAEELEAALGLLESVPSLGATYDESKGVRRVLLKKTGYHVYFVQRADVLTVVAVWAGRRKHGPPLP